MNPFENKNILILQQRSWAKSVGHPLAIHLQSLGCKLYAITIHNKAHVFVTKKQTEVKYESVYLMDPVRENPQAFLGNEIISLEEICKNLGVLTIWPLVQSARNHVKSYTDKYYYGFKQNKSDDEIILYVKACYKFVRDTLEMTKPDCIVSPNFVGLPHIFLNLYARARNVDMIAISDSKVDGYFYFPKHFTESDSRLIDKLKDLNNGQESVYRAKAKQYIEEKKNRILNDRLPKQKVDIPFKRKIKDILLPYYRCFLFYRKYGFTKIQKEDVTIDNLPPKYILRDHFSHKKNIKDITEMTYFDFAKVGKFIYMPLQFQPEETIDVDAPRFNNQIETARQVAMSLPDDYTLVVKDHPAMLGYRPKSYLDKVAKTPNVKLIDFRIPTSLILEKCSGVISSNGGSILAEAAIFQKPSIQLGELGKTLQLPNVIHHSNLSTLPEVIVRMLNQKFENSDYNLKLENYVCSVYEVGFTDQYNEAWGGETHNNLQNMCKSFTEEIRLSKGFNK